MDKDRERKIVRERERDVEKHICRKDRQTIILPIETE